MLSLAAQLLMISQVFAGPVELKTRQSCPSVHVFGARETTAPAGYGSAGSVVDSIVSANPGATSEAIDYPAAGDSQYGASVQAGFAAVGSQVTTFAQGCPDTQIVLVGYSQGAQIMDNAVCGGGDPNQGISDTNPSVSSDVGAQIKAMILMGNPRHDAAAPYSVGSATAPGFDPRNGEICTEYADRIQSYCDAADPYCSNGSDASVHQGYGTQYGQQALEFVNSKLS